MKRSEDRMADAGVAVVNDGGAGTIGYAT